MRIALLGGSDAEQITQGRPVSAKKSREDRSVENAHESKIRATADWVDGRIDSKEHGAIHKRADKVIACKGRM